MSVSPDICLAAESFRADRTTRIRETVGVVISAISMSSLLYVYSTRKTRAFVFHGNFKLILCHIWLSAFIHTLFGVLINSYDIIIHAFASYCGTIYTRWSCGMLRWPIMATSISMTLLHFSAFLERMMASRCRSRYERTGNVLGITLVIVSWLLTLMVSYITLITPNIMEVVPYCMTTFHDTKDRLRILMYCLATVDAITTTGDLCLYIMNRKGVASKYNNYSLSGAFQRTENYLTSRLMFPVSLTYSMFFLMFLLSSSITRTLFDYDGDSPKFTIVVGTTHYFVHCSIVGTVIVYVKISKRMQREKTIDELKCHTHEGADVHFLRIRSMWNL